MPTRAKKAIGMPTTMIAIGRAKTTTSRSPASPMNAGSLRSSPGLTSEIGVGSALGVFMGLWPKDRFVGVPNLLILRGLLLLEIGGALRRGLRVKQRTGLDRRIRAVV